MKCPKCQAELPDDMQFCGVCGAALRVEVVCQQCGFANPPTFKFCGKCGKPLAGESAPQQSPASVGTSSVPTSFVSGRYQVKKFLGEGGKKKVYLAHDTVLDRDVAFALIKTEKLDAAARTRIKREAQAMGRLGDHPNIVTVFDFGDHEGQPYMVLPLLSGGDVEGLIKKAPDHKLPMDQSMEIARSVCKGLEFAHAKGIIHRDIKPGNVWMSADGTAKVGDFGLAVAVDLSRLTQAGMMVGTVSYMPPEQAMGGKVTARADLYSLGAMLYEMVTGRPPFVGDDSVAIIGQHINTPPVSPSWHRADLPPALETLIMQLLEKDPEKRPASATVILQALESIGKEKVKAETVKEVKPEVENPLYRKVFVGRESELKQLQSAFDSAMSGQGSLMMVLGEPGIGKTALCEQLATYVTLRGGRTLVGHCYEEGSLSLPYLAFVEAMRSYVLSREVKDLRAELGTGAADVARIVSEIRERLKVKLRTQKDPEEERYRLMQAVMSFLTNASSTQPMMVVLEDLHDADKGTLDMLIHVSRNLAGARFLIVGTYRDVEVDRTHPLSAALAELRRVSTFGRVVLRGLNADEVRRMLDSITQESIPWSLAQAVHRQTEGNPLFVQEVVRLLVEQKMLVRNEKGMVAANETSVEMSIPEGLRDVIGKRLSRLSPACNQVLAVAAVIGRDFDLRTLQKVTTVTEEELYSALEEGTAAAVLEGRSSVGRGSSFRFAHAFFRQTLYGEMFAPRRIRIHQQVGRAFEEVYAQRLEDHAAELAEHFSQSTEAGDLAKAVEYGEIAAKRAISVYAYGEAVRLYEGCIKAQEVLDPGDKARHCDLLLGLGDALILAGEPRRCADAVAPPAFALAVAMADNQRAFLASLLGCRALMGYGQRMAFAAPEGRLWAERADHYAASESTERVRADYYLGSQRFASRQFTEGIRLCAHGLELARRLDDNPSFLIAAGLWLYMSGGQDAAERLKVAEEIMRRPRLGLTPIEMESVSLYLFCFFLSAGQRSRAEKILGELRDVSERSGQANVRLRCVDFQARLAIFDGRLDEAEDMIRRELTEGAEAGLAEFARPIVMVTGARALLELGKAEEALRIVQEPSLGDPRTLAVITAPCLAHLGRRNEVAEILGELGVTNSEAGSVRNETGFDENIKLFESATLAGHREATSLLLRRFPAGPMMPFNSLAMVCTSRLLGAAKVLLERHDEARTDYQEAIKVCTEKRFRPELALSRLQLAELLLDHYSAERKEALEHLDFAIKEFREMKMQPSLEQALRRKEILKA